MGRKEAKVKNGVKGEWWCHHRCYYLIMNGCPLQTLHTTLTSVWYACGILTLIVLILVTCVPTSNKKIKRKWGFPGGAVVESLPANAGYTGWSPGLGRSHMPRSNWAREPQLLSLRVWSLCSTTREATIVRGPRTAMRVAPACRN